jgi:hypothetical protein
MMPTTEPNEQQATMSELQPLRIDDVFTRPQQPIELSA